MVPKCGFNEVIQESGSTYNGGQFKLTPVNQGAPHRRLQDIAACSAKYRLALFPNNETYFLLKIELVVKYKWCHVNGSVFE